MKKATKLVAALLITGLLTGCAGNGNTDATKDLLLATETTAATETTKATTPKATPKPTTKPSTTKTTKPTGKTESTKATEATKPAESQKPAETPKPTNPPATEAPKPTNPPATNPPATEAPKPTDPPETEPALEPYHYDIYEAMEYGNSYAASFGFNIDYSLNTAEDGYVMTTTIPESYLDYEGGQSNLNSLVIEKIDSTMGELNAAYGTTDWSVVRGLAYVECTTSNGEPAYRIYFLYG